MRRESRYPPAAAAGSQRRIGLAVAFGVGLGFVFALWHVQSTSVSSPESKAALKEIQDATEKIQKLLAEAERQQTDVKAKIEATRKLHEVRKSAKVGEGQDLRVHPVGQMQGPTHSPLLIPNRGANPGLAAVLEKVAVNNELIVGISNINIRDMLEAWWRNIQRLGIKNYMVVALDEATKILCENNGVPVYRQEAKIAKTQQGGGDNHAISSSKFHLIRDFLVMGYAVFLSDIDILFLQDPFKGQLRRDADVEGMTDGFSNNTAYGWDDHWDDASLGPKRIIHTNRIFVFNSGLFYIRPTVASLELLDRVADRLAKEKAWDQAVYNEEMFFPSSPSRVGLYISKRTLDFYSFLNSKTLFKEVRKQARFDNHLPVSLHVNYHPDKFPRMIAAEARYVKGKKDALDKFPDGSE